MIPGVSIVICTYNGAQKLPETLFHIAQQQVRPEINWELIIIDNDSTDNSTVIAREEWKKYKCPVNFVVKHEPQLGLTVARESGIKIARYDYIILCDDDNWLSPEYVNIAYDIMRNNKKIGVLGGNGELVYEQEPPSWMLKFNVFAGGKQARYSGKVKSNLVYGSCCILRRSAYKELKQKGFQFMLSDRVGTKLESGGDHELCYALALSQYEVWHDERLHFRHFITKERTTWEYMLRYVKESSHCFEVLEAYKILLKTGKSKVHFQMELGISFIYFLIRLFPVMLVKIFSSSETEKGKIAILKYILLKERLFLLNRYSNMKANFCKASVLINY